MQLEVKIQAKKKISNGRFDRRRGEPRGRIMPLTTWAGVLALAASSSSPPPHLPPVRSPRREPRLHRDPDHRQNEQDRAT